MRFKVLHRIHRTENVCDGEQLVEMEDGERWKLKNIIIINQTKRK